ncbi:cleft lip and palate transmembrane protein 1-like protein [Trichogramma pretiosum]|uniref:cleft lip and palate transmembrane protein 1-like protein n=1 Tax=Trichogramma pretiosum TaxID=7493 RepID=UPI0006C94904|nr:cleft lip and palate transmembrane protein 1-like protein [Trichogramma pretiosum]
MRFPSISFLLSGIFIAYVAYAIYTISLLFNSLPCSSKETCIKSYLSDRPKLQLNLFVSTMRRPLRSEVTKIHTDMNFDYMHEHDIPLVIDIPAKTRNNGTLYLHVIVSPQSFIKGGQFMDFKEDFRSIYTLIKLTDYAIPKAETFNLLGEETDNALKKQKYVHKPVLHLRSKVTFTVMTDDIELPLNNAPMELLNNLRVTPENKFLPIINYNFLYTRYRDLIKITAKTRSANLTVSHSPISLGKLRLILHIEAAMQGFKELGFTDKDIDEVKGIFADTNLYLLAGTVFISAIHILFDFLAIKNDINFWKNRNNLEGLSTQTVLWRSFSQSVIFFYLLDEGSSLLVLVPSGIGALIELWKTKKILRADIIWNSQFPKIKFNLSKCSTAEAKTRQFDAESMKYLSYLLYPILIFGAVYSLLYVPHRSWYSWCVKSLVNGVYAFGFLFMLPQLFVNYKLKSVAHLPWRSFMYKAFNTFIDDIFAFIITMPTAHRVACFRDDAVFLIYLYQRWLYPVDKNRIDSGTFEQDISITNDDSDKKKS